MIAGAFCKSQTKPCTWRAVHKIAYRTKLKPHHLNFIIIMYFDLQHNHLNLSVWCAKLVRHNNKQEVPSVVNRVHLHWLDGWNEHKIYWNWLKNEEDAIGWRHTFLRLPFASTIGWLILRWFVVRFAHWIRLMSRTWNTIHNSLSFAQPQLYSQIFSLI